MRWRLDDGQIEVVDEAVAEVLRRKTLCERIAMILACNRTMRLLIAGHVCQENPKWPGGCLVEQADLLRRLGEQPGK